MTVAGQGYARQHFAFQRHYESLLPACGGSGASALAAAAAAAAAAEAAAAAAAAAEIPRVRESGQLGIRF
jgi:hypothetical protein